MVTTQPFVFMLSKSVLVLFVASFIVRLLFVLFFFRLTCFVQPFSIWIFNFQCIFWFWYWNCSPGFSIPVTTTIWQSINIKHQTAPSLSKYRKQEPITIIDTVGYSEPISPYGLSRGWDRTFEDILSLIPHDKLFLLIPIFSLYVYPEQRNHRLKVKNTIREVSASFWHQEAHRKSLALTKWSAYIPPDVHTNWMQTPCRCSMQMACLVCL